MNKLFVGLGLSAIGVLLIIITIIGWLPVDGGIEIAIIAVGWVFLIIGSIIRYKELKPN